MKARNTFTLLVVVCALIAGSVRADRVKLKDGTTLEGVVIKQSDGYWVKTPDGQSHVVKQSEVLSVESGSPKPGPAIPSAPGATAGKPTTRTGALISFSTATYKANSSDSALQAVTYWQQYVDQNPASADLPAAKKELARWKALADSGAEKIKGKWAGGAERKAILTKADKLTREAQELMKANQTLAAVKKLEEAASIYPNSYDTNFRLGYLAMLQHNEDKAIAWFDEALRLQPDAPEALTNKGVVLVSKKQYEKGIALIRKALTEEDRQEIVSNLITAISITPANLQKTKELKEAQSAAMLLASKYNISGPSSQFVIVTPKARSAKPSSDDPETPPAGMWSGTGFVIADDGLILTNRHVAKNASTLMVMMDGGVQKSAEVVVIDDDQDLALIRVKTDGKKLPIVKLAPGDAPPDGAECTVMGYPLLDRLGASVKITRGIVSSAARRESGPDVMVDAKVNPGNSGGPMLDKHGNVMAIVSMKTRSAALEDSYGLGISAGNIRRFLEKNNIKVQAGATSGASLSAEEIAARVKPAAVCILATK